MDAPRIAWVGWVVEVCGSLRQAQGRLSGTRVGTPRTGGDRRTASEAWLLLAVWFDTGRRVYGAPAHHERGRAGGEGARRTTWVGWVLGAVWFDTPRRETLGRLTTNGVGDGMGAPRIAWVGWVVEVCGSLRQAQGRLSGTRVGTPRTGGDRRTASEAWLLLTVWFDTGRRVRRPGSPRTGWGRRRGCAEDRLSGLGAGGCVVRHAPPRDSGAAHHERGGGFSPWLRFGGLVVGGAASRG